MRPFIALAIATYVLLEAARPQLAQACSGLPCNLPAAFPVPEGGEVPANFGELTVFTESTFPRAAGYTLKLWKAGAPDTVLRTVQVGAHNQNRAELGDLLAPGTSYVVEASSCGEQFGTTFKPDIRTLHFTLAQGASDPPSTLGPLTVARHGPTTVPWGGGAGCYYDLTTDAVDFTLDPSALPEAWRKLVNSYQLMVDGEPFSWTLTIGSDDYGPKDRARGFYFAAPGTFRAFTECFSPDDDSEAPPPGERGLAPGKHSAWVAARVPTSPAKIVESERVEIELACPQRDAGPSTDGGPHGDSGPSTQQDGHDAGAQDPPRTDESSADDPESSPAKTEDGCALSTRGAHATNWPAYGLLTVALALLRRKQAVRSRHTRRSSERKRS